MKQKKQSNLFEQAQHLSLKCPVCSAAQHFPSPLLDQEFFLPSVQGAKKVATHVEKMFWTSFLY
jgi:hypothetical protein